MPWWISETWNWFWYYRRGKIKFNVWDFGDTYNAMACNGETTVWNCYGSTPEAAKEMALVKLNLALKEESKERELVNQSDGFAHYHDK
ncbi:hypothetical protein [Bacillus sp. OK048]|uniref:hypothetical protein n=1 Tax=Bacillus sp. OK048 TaxID=1882761 RepID=UPI0008860C7B|nr:hypothetical protein [Bacillus sp. OK048]SDM16932.1 hypothetical protein SAMN05443253_102147 [Bacillus sp. OK048]